MARLFDVFFANGALLPCRLPYSLVLDWLQTSVDVGLGKKGAWHCLFHLVKQQIGQSFVGEL